MTKDSYSVAMRKVDVAKNNYDRQGIAEVFKYAVKFTTLNTPQLVQLIDLQKRKQYRFYATYGIFRGWEQCASKKPHGERKEVSMIYNPQSQHYEMENNTHSSNTDKRQYIDSTMIDEIVASL